MITYPSILKPSRAPHLPCISFCKLDGSNIRVKYSPKKGFHLYGSREQLFDHTHPFLAGAIPSFESRYQEFLLKKFHEKEFTKAKEINEFLKPQDFIKLAGDSIEIPRVVFQGNFGPQLIQDVREDKFDTNEGVICKGTEYLGNYSGKIWMAKIKTQKYLDKLKNRFNDEWEKFAE